jgi:hypothetical protein
MDDLYSAAGEAENGLILEVEGLQEAIASVSDVAESGKTGIEIDKAMHLSSSSVPCVPRAKGKGGVFSSRLSYSALLLFSRLRFVGKMNTIRQLDGNDDDDDDDDDDVSVRYSFGVHSSKLFLGRWE